MKNILSIGRRFSIWMVLLAFLGCSDDDLDGLPQVVSSFTYTVNQDTGTVTFVNVSEGARTYVWDFGDGTTSKEIDPIKTYSDSGTYKVTLVASNQAGASSTFEDELTLNIKQDITLPITFDDTNVIYEASTFDGAAFEIVANPDVSGSNDKETNVGEITNSGAAFEGLFFDLGTPVDLTTDKTITMNFWSEAPIDVLMKLEEGTGAATETSASHGGTGWEEISFDFTSSASYSRLTLFVDGPGTTAGIFYFDDVEQAGTDPGGDDCTAETEQSLDASDFNLTFLTDPGSAIIGDGAAYSYIDNPDTDNDVNPSCKVGQIDRNPGLPFANNQIVFDSKFDFTANTGFKLKVWAPVAGTNVLLKLEDKSNSAVNTEVAAVTATGNAWEELTFDFSSVPSDTYDKIVLFFDINTDSGATYYIDDFALYSEDGGGDNPLEDCGGDLVNDFESADDSIFNNFGGGVGTIIDNPDTSVNTSAKVAQYVKGAGEVFAGITIEVDPDIDFNAGVFSIDVNSQAVRQLLFKLEGLGIEQIIPTSGTGWETITYDFSSAAGNIGAVTAITLIMDNGTAGDGSGDWTIQFDNIRLCSNESSGGDNPLEDCGGDLVNDFESADDSIFNNFGGGVGTIIDNPDTSINTSAKVAQYVKGAGEVFAGITIEVDPDIDFNAGVFSIDVNSQAVRQLLFKLEGLGIEQIIPTSGTGWETITYDFSSAAGNIGAVTAITLIMDNGTAGDGSGDWTIQFDNIRLCSNESPGGGPPGSNLAVNGDFETGDDTGWFIFQNGGSAALDNTTSNGGTWSGSLSVSDSGGNPAFKQERIGAGTVAAGDVVQVQFDHIGSVVQPGAAVNVLLFGESPAGASFTQVLTPGPVLENTWTTYTGSFTIPAGTDVSEGISFLIETVCGAVAGCNVTMNIDNVSVTLNP